MADKFIEFDKESKAIIINDRIKKHHGGLIILSFTQLFVSIVNVSRAISQGWDLTKFFWLVLGVLHLSSLLWHYFKANRSNIIFIHEIKHYKTTDFWGQYKVSLFLRNGKIRRIIKNNEREYAETISCLQETAIKKIK